MDTVGAGIGGQVPLLENMPLHNEDGADFGHMYSPWWLYKEQLAGKLGFARGYHFEFGGGRRMPDMGTASGLEWLNGGTYGRKFKEDARRYYGSFVYFSGRGEMIPNEDSFAELDPNVKDKFGIPVLRFHWKWSAARNRTGRAHAENRGGNHRRPWAARHPALPQPGDKAIKQGGVIIHEVGGAIMGTDAKNSVTNSFGQCWDMKNLFITDGATLCSNADKNPTLTIMALAWRACRSHAEPHEEEGAVMDRRTTIKWMFAAAAAMPRCALRAGEPVARDVAAGQAGYGTDPDLVKEWKPGGPWPLTLTASGRRTTQALCDLIIPADEHSPAASAVGVVDFIDEWISAPYPNQRGDRDIVLPGLSWIDAEANKRFGKDFADITDAQKSRHRRRHLLAGESGTGIRQGREVLREIPRSHRRRLLHHARSA